MTPAAGRRPSAVPHSLCLADLRFHHREKAGMRACVMRPGGSLRRHAAPPRPRCGAPKRRDGGSSERRAQRPHGLPERVQFGRGPSVWVPVVAFRMAPESCAEFGHRQRCGKCAGRKGRDVPGEPPAHDFPVTLARLVGVERPRQTRRPPTLTTACPDLGPLDAGNTRPGGCEGGRAFRLGRVRC